VNIFLIRTRPFLCFLAIAWILASCSGVFVNPDLVGVESGNSAHRLFTLDLPAIPPQESRILQDLKFECITLNDFFILQGMFLDAARAYAAVGDSFGFSGSVPPINHKDEFLGKRDRSSYDHTQWLSGRSRSRRPVWQLDGLSSDQLVNILSAGFPVVCFGQCRFKHRMQRDKGAEDVTFVYDGFTLVSGYERYRERGSGYDNISDSRVRFFTRDGLGIRCEDTTALTGRTFSMDNSIDKNGRWLFKEFYLFLPSAMDGDSLKTLCGPELKVFVMNQTQSRAFQDQYSCERSKNEDAEKEKREQEEKEKQQKTNPQFTPPPINYVPQRF